MSANYGEAQSLERLATGFCSQAILRRFRPIKEGEDTLGVLVNDKFAIVKWNGGNIYFSFARLGAGGISAHFSSDKGSLRDVKQACSEFCEWAKYVMPWCDTVFAVIRPRSVAKMVEKIGFYLLAVDVDGQRIYARHFL